MNKDEIYKEEKKAIKSMFDQFSDVSKSEIVIITINM